MNYLALFFLFSFFIFIFLFAITRMIREINQEIVQIKEDIEHLEEKNGRLG